jgi:hypothetical protein
MANLQIRAAEAAAWLEPALRDENDPESSFIRLRDGAPEWVRDLVHAAHGEFLPDDWRYDKIQEALLFIAENEDAEDRPGSVRGGRRSVRPRAPVPPGVGLSPHAPLL